MAEQKNSILPAELQDGSMQVLTKAPDILMLNDSQVQGALAKLKELVAKIKAEGMNAELDALANKYLVRTKAILEECNGRRKPITSILSGINKQFTSLEALINPESTEYAALQKFRNQWAAQLAEDKRKKDAEILKNQKMAEERVNTSYNCALQISNAFTKHVAETRQLLLDIMANTTLESCDEDLLTIKNFPTVYQESTYKSIPFSFSANIYLPLAEAHEIARNTMGMKFASYSADYQRAIQDTIQDIVVQWPGKIMALQAIANQQDADKKRELQEAEDKRKKDAADAIKKQQEDAADKAKKSADAEKAVKLTNTLFDSHTELVQNQGTTQKVVEGYELELLHPSAWLNIVSFWFKIEGGNLEVEELGKKTLASMKKSIEAYTKKQGASAERIESPYVKYNEKFTVKAQ